MNPQQEPPAPLVEEVATHEEVEINSQINRDIPQPHDRDNVEREEPVDVVRQEPPSRNDQEDDAEASFSPQGRGRRRNRNRNQARDRHPGNDHQHGSGRRQ